MPLIFLVSYLDPAPTATKVVTESSCGMGIVIKVKPFLSVVLLNMSESLTDLYLIDKIYLLPYNILSMQENFFNEYACRLWVERELKALSSVEDWLDKRSIVTESDLAKNLDELVEYVSLGSNKACELDSWFEARQFTDEGKTHPGLPRLLHDALVLIDPSIPKQSVIDQFIFQDLPDEFMTGDLHFAPHAIRTPKYSTHITRDEYLIGRLLVANQNWPLSRKDIYQTIRPNGTPPKNFRSVDVDIYRLRKKLGSPYSESFRTVPGFGYVYLGPSINLPV